MHALKRPAGEKQPKSLPSVQLLRGCVVFRHTLIPLRYIVYHIVEAPTLAVVYLVYSFEFS